VTGESAQVIADVLKSEFKHDVDVVNLKEHKSPDIGPYGTVFIGSGIRAGQWYGAAKKMLKRDYSGKKLCLFLSACSAGDPDPKKHDEAVEKYLTKKIAKRSNLKPTAVNAFGGRMKMGGKGGVDNFDPDKVRAWVKEIGRNLA
jgi:menaquinone-dependent protoporphyrinogen IX oxidase